MTEVEYDTVIVGGGPGGLTAAIYGGRAELKTLLIEKGGYGGRITETAEVKNYPGVKLDSGEHLMESFKEHAQANESVSMKRTTVTQIKKEGDDFIVSTKRRGDFKTKTVILDLGTVPRELNIPGEKEFAGQGVSYCATCDAEFFKDQEIYVVGAGDQAIEESEYLAKFAKKVNIVVLHDPGVLDCNEVAAKNIKNNPKVNFIWDSTLNAIEGTDKVEKVQVKNVNTGKITEHQTSGVFFFIGMTPQTQIVKDLVEEDQRGYILVNNKQETSVPGLYAIGDCTDNYLKQVITACGDGARAVVAAQRLISEQQQLNNILSEPNAKIAFVFYDPYQDGDIDKATELEKELSDYKVFKQDISRQSLLFKKLNLDTTVTAALFENGDLQKIINNISELKLIKN